MKFLLLLLFFGFSFLPASEHEVRTLAHVEITEGEATFYLDNGWIFKGAVPHEEKLLNFLNTSIGFPVQISHNACKAGFQLSIGQTGRVVVALPYETFTMLPFIVSIEIENPWLFYTRLLIHLSDGSVWKTSLYWNTPRQALLPIDPWSEGDRVIVTKSLTNPQRSLLVNVAISNAFITVYREYDEDEWLDLKDFRTLECEEI